MTKKLNLDQGLLLAVFALCGIGLVQVYSSSFIYATDSRGDGLFFFKRQLIVLAIGLVVLAVTVRIPNRWLEKTAPLLWLVGFVGVVATLLPGFGISAGGASRWLRLPGSTVFEPSELMKVGLALFLAGWIARKEDDDKTKYGWRIIFLLLPIALIVKQPDFGTAAIMFLVILSLLFAYGLKWRYIIVALLVATPAVYFLVWRVAFRRARILAFLDPWAEIEKTGFQVIQSLLSFQSGRLTGVGLGEGQGKLFFLPEAHTDFTLAVLGEEAGFIGFLLVMILYGYVIYCGLKISLRAKQTFNRALALGLTLTFAASVFINCGVVLGMLPTKGLALPFLSYGGSSLICNCLLFGLLLNVDRNERVGKPLVHPYASVVR